MIQALGDMLLNRSPRERGLMAVMTFVALPLAVVFLILLPMQQNRADARIAVENSRALLKWTIERDRDFAALGPVQQESTPQSVAAIGISGIEQSLVAADLRTAVSALTNQPGGRVELRFDTVEFGVLTDWLNAMEAEWGYELGAFTLTKLEEPGLVAADFLLEPQG